MSVQGRTATDYDDYFASDDQPRIWRMIDEDSRLPRYHMVAPCGHRAVLSEAHEVDEHDDGTFSVQPKPNNSNSILCPKIECGWHGYVDHNVWTEV